MEGAMNTEVVFNRKEKFNLFLYLFSRGFLSFGDSIYSFAISFFILYETGSALASSINLVVFTLVNLICLPFAGYIADKYNKKIIIIIGELIDPIIILGLLIYTMNYGFDLTAIYIVTGITTFTSAFVGNSFQAAMTEIFNALHMQKVMGYQQSIMSLSNIIAPATAGALIGLTSLEVILGIFVVLGFVAVFIDLIIDFKLHYDESLYEKTEELTFWNDLMEGARHIMKSDVLRPIVVFLVFINFFASLMSIYPSKVLIVELGLRSETVGIVYAVISLGSIIASVFIAKIKRWENPVRVTKICSFICAGLLMLFAVPLYLPVSLTVKVIMISALFLANAITLTFLNTPMMVYFQTAIPQRVKGRVLSMLSISSMSVMPIGVVIYGYFLDLDYYLGSTLVSGIMVCAVVMFTLPNSLIMRSKKEMDDILTIEKGVTESLVTE